MTREEKRKIEKRVLILSLGFLALAIIFLVLAGVFDFVETLLYPVGLSVILLGYWIVTDVCSVVWLGSFKAKTAAQKKAYYIFAGLEMAGFAGLIWFLVDMQSTTGLAVYIASMLLKKKFRDEYDGVVPKQEEASGAEDAAELPEETEEDSEYRVDEVSEK